VSHPNYSPAAIPGSPPPWWRDGFGVEADPIVLSTVDMMTIYGGGSVDAEVTDQITGSLQCQGDGPFPVKQSFLILPQYMGWTNVFDQTLMGDTATASMSDEFGSATSMSWNGYWGTDIETPQSGLVTVPVDQFTGVAAVSINAHYSVVCSSGGDGGGSYANCLEGFDAVPDTRSVSISSGTNAKVPIPAPIVGEGPPSPYWLEDEYGNEQFQPGSELTDTDGTTHGDTTFSGYIDVPTGGVNPVDGSPITWEEPVPNWQYFTPTFSGSWGNWGPPITPTIYDPNDPTGNETRTIGDPAVTWGWSPSESDDWEMYGKCSMPEDPYVASSGPAVPYNVSYTATSLASPVATATAKCDLMVHQNVEVKAINSPTDTTDPNYYSTQTYPAVLTSSAAQPGGSETYSYAPGVALYGSFSGDGTMLQAISAALFEIPEASAILNLAGFLANSINDNTSTTGTAIYNSVWPTGNPADINVWNGTPPPGWVPGVTYLGLANPKEAQFCTFTVKEVVYYKNTLYSCDTWGSNGYVRYSEDFVGTNSGTGQPQATWTYSGN
jgi:hypothetical protein